MATLGGTLRALRRSPRMTGVVVLSMGLPLLAAELLLNFVLAANDVAEVCPRD
jgi:hypothetical protein